MSEKRPPLGGTIDWDEIQDNQNKRNSKEGEKKYIKVPYIKLSPGQSVRFRIVSSLCEFWRHYKPIQAISPGKDYDVAWREGNYKPKKQYTAYVINRNDGAINAWDFGFTNLQTIMSWMEVNNKTKPSDYDRGCDWILQCKTVKQEGRSQVRYTLLPADVKPLTKEERDTVEKFIVENPLSVLRKPNTAEEITELYEAYLKNPEDPNVPGSGKWYKARIEARKATSTVTAQPTASPSKSSSINFDEDDSSVSESSYSKLIDNGDDSEGSESATLF